MSTSFLAQCLGTQELQAKHGTQFTIAKLLYTTLAANSEIPARQLAVQVAKTLPELEKIGPDKIAEWAKEYNWDKE